MAPRTCSGILATIVVGGVLSIAPGCGGSSGSSPTQPTSPPAAGGGSGGDTTPTVTITTSGVQPSEVTIAPGGRVRFVNNNSRAHDMSSDPHPDHSDCPEINQVGFIQPGQTKETGNFVTAKTCGFHDHNQPSNNALRGRIVVR